MKARDIPNVLSMLRMSLAVPSALLLLQEWYNAALLIFLVAGLSDALDGYLARRTGQRCVPLAIFPNTIEDLVW